MTGRDVATSSRRPVGKWPAVGGKLNEVCQCEAVCLDAFTQTHVTNNKASTAYPDIDGPYTTCP
jgi:hypothetical protein